MTATLNARDDHSKSHENNKPRIGVADGEESVRSIRMTLMSSVCILICVVQTAEACHKGLPKGAPLSVSLWATGGQRRLRAVSHVRLESETTVG